MYLAGVMEEDTRQTPTKTRWQLITDSLTPKKASPSIAPILQSTRLAFSDKMHSVLMQANKPQRSMHNLFSLAFLGYAAHMSHTAAVVLVAIVNVDSDPHSETPPSQIHSNVMLFIR